VTSLRPESACVVEQEAAETLRSTRPVRRDAAIELVARDPVAMLECLWWVGPMVSSPRGRDSGWRLVADQIRSLARQMGDDV